MNEEEKKAHDEAVKKAMEANTKRNNDRLAQMEAIADNNDNLRAEDMDDAEAKEAEAARESEETARALQAEGATEEPSETVPESKETDSDTKQVNGETYYRQIVNGVEKWQNLREIRAAAQKVESADEYLREASESVKNASRLALSKKDEPVLVGKDDLKKLLASLALGDEEAIEKLASVIVSRPSEVTPDVLRAVDQRLSFRTELTELEKAYSDVLSDPDAGDLFRARLEKLKTEAPDTTLSEAYKKIGEPLRARFKTANTLQAKLERKRTLPQVPVAAARQQTESEEEGEEDVSQVIEKMAKARGGTVVMHGSGPTVGKFSSRQ